MERVVEKFGDQVLLGEFLHHAFHDVNGVGNCHGDLGNSYPSFYNGFRRTKGVVG